MADDAFFIDGLALTFLAILFLIIATWGFFKDRKEYKRTKKFNSYHPPVLLQAGYDGGFNGAWFEFREDGTYKFANSGGIGATYIRGKYRLKGNNIILDRDNLDNAVLTKFLLI
jgi:hypothetical protein